MVRVTWSCAVQVRSAKLADVPCTCLALLDPQGDNLSSHPFALAGCYNNKVPASPQHPLLNSCFWHALCTFLLLNPFGTAL